MFFPWCCIFFHLDFQIPILNIQMKMVPAIFTLLGAIFSCTNYFRVIFTGGVGKNGSTIAVSLQNRGRQSFLSQDIVAFRWQNFNAMNEINSCVPWSICFLGYIYFIVLHNLITYTLLFHVRGSSTVCFCALREPVSSPQFYTLVRLSFWQWWYTRSLLFSSSRNIPASTSWPLAVSRQKSQIN